MRCPSLHDLRNLHVDHLGRVREQIELRENRKFEKKLKTFESFATNRIEVDVELFVLVAVTIVDLARPLYQLDELQVVAVQLRPVNHVINEVQLAVAGGSRDGRCGGLRAVEVRSDHLPVRLQVEGSLEF